MSDPSFAAPAQPDGLRCTRAGMPGVLTLDDPVVWREERGVEESLPAPEVIAVAARRAGHVQTFWIVGLGLAMAAKFAGLTAGFGVAALWVGLVLRLVLDRVRPTVHLTLGTTLGSWTLISTEWSAVDRVLAWKRAHPHATGQGSLDEVLSDAWAQVRATGAHARAHRILGAWNIFWLVALPHLFWVAMWAIAFAGAVSEGKPTGETFVILGMGPPITVGLWPLSALPGGWLMVPFTPLLRWMVER